MLSDIFSLHSLIGLLALTAMEIVLGIDNIVFITVSASKLPAAQQASARKLGLALAMVMRIVLLFAITWIVGMKEPLFALTTFGIEPEWLQKLGMSHETAEEVNNVSIRDLIMIAGGLFLIQSAVREIHEKVEGHSEGMAPVKRSYAGVIAQIILFDIIFSIDSVITAVGMSRQIWVMVAAVVISVGVMLVFAETVANFVERHPTVKMLALSFLLLIGVMLFAEGIGTEIDKAYIYFAMAFSLLVEFLNLRRTRKRQAAVHAA